MNHHKFRLLLTVLSVLGLVLAGTSVPAWAQSPLLPTYYAAQLGGGALAALAGGLGGTLVGGLSGALLGVAVEALHDPFGIFKEVTSLDEFPMRPIRWAFVGAKVGFGLGVGVGAAVGVVQVASAFGISGDPQGAMIGALAGSLFGMVFLLDSARPFIYWSVTGTEVRAKARSGVVLKLLVNPVTLAALGATIGYNLGTKKKEHTTAIAIPIFALQF